jgi:hypothetical protein
MDVIFCVIGQFRPVRLECMIHSAVLLTLSSPQGEKWRRMNASLDITRTKGLGIEGLNDSRKMTIIKAGQMDSTSP